MAEASPAKEPADPKTPEDGSASEEGKASKGKETAEQKGEQKAEEKSEEKDEKKDEKKDDEKGEQKPEQQDRKEEAAFDEGALGQSATVINNFFDAVDASQSVFGVASRRSTRTMTGTLGPADIERALDSFVPPPCFEDALAKLCEHRVLVLVSREDTGKWTSAVALLNRVKRPDTKIIVLSPARALDDLASKTAYRNGWGYVIQGWTPDDIAPALQHFEFETLARTLEEADAHLVLTVHRDPATAAPGPFHMRWQIPEPLALFDAHLGGMVLTDELAEVRAHAAELRSPGQIAGLARQIAVGGRSPADVLAEISDSEVTKWFERQPKRSEVLVVAALAFAYNLPERIFERLLVDFERIAEDVKLRGREPGAQNDDDTLPQHRAQWSGDHPLITVDSSSDLLAGERRIVFRAARHREQVITELMLLYSYDLWEPLRLWIRALADDLPEVQAQVAEGLSLLAAVNPQEVRESFLEPWAAGPASEQIMATLLLSMMCANDTLAPIALRTVLGWAVDAGRRRAMTAALAFAGGLSIRYPADSIDWLWFLSLRAIDIRVVAIRALVLLIQGAAEREEGASQALRLLTKHIELELHGPIDPGYARKALAVALEVLNAVRLDTEDDPLAAWLLLNEPDSARPLGTLWAWALRSGHYRRDAIQALYRTLRALCGKDGARAAAMALGKVVWSSLPPNTVPLVKRAIERAGNTLREGREDAGRTRELVLAVLAASAGGGLSSSTRTRGVMP
ncbi:hypothetical protein [Nonomuraea fastidiosa]